MLDLFVQLSVILAARVLDWMDHRGVGSLDGMDPRKFSGTSPSRRRRRDRVGLWYQYDQSGTIAARLLKHRRPWGTLEEGEIAHAITAEITP